MKFEENIRELRKQHGHSQEELADKLNVSRQAVSKWENGSAYPELDKLMLLCEIFHCSMDDLLQGDMSEKKGVNLERYEKHYHMMSMAMTFGVTVILAGAVCYCYLEPYFMGKRETILNIIFLVFVIVGVLAFVYYGMQDSSFRKKYPQIPQHMYKESELEAFEKRYTISTVIGVGIILLSVLVQLMLSGFYTDAFANGSFMLMVTIAVAIFVYFGSEKSKYSGTEKQKEKLSKNKETIGKWCGAIMLLTTAVYLLWSFVWKDWDISWVVFPIGGILCGVVSSLLYKEEGN